MIYIVAGNNNEYRHWASEQDPRLYETRYLAHADQIRGMSSIEGLFIGTCYDRLDIEEIVNYINVIRSRTKPIIKLESLRHLSRHNSISATTVLNDFPSSFKVSLAQIRVDSFTLVTANLYKSYITNTFDLSTNSIEYYFTKKEEALDFAKKHNSVALEYK